MKSPPAAILTTQQRNLLYLRSPRLWPTWPFLPVIRRQSRQETEFGVMFDAFHSIGRPGYSATVFFCNLAVLPKSINDFLLLPRESFDTADELFAAGWRVD